MSPVLNIIIALISAMVPFLYALIISKFPSFPIPENMLLEILVWVVMEIFAGYHVACFYHKSFSKHYVYNKNKQHTYNLK